MSGAQGTAGGFSAEELELMALLLEEAGIEDAAPGTIARRPSGARVPLTFAQRRLWFLEQLEPETRIYNDAFSHRLVGDLDVAALQAAIDGLVERHESLRTVFVEEGGEPLQVVRENCRIPLEIHDLSRLPEGEQMEEVRRIADRATYTPFDLSRGPLLRPVLMRLGERDHALVIAVHHIINDGWSLGIFFTELSALYDAARKGEPSPLPPLALQYGDFAVWQHEHLSDAAIERQMTYWKERLRGAPTVLELPTGRVRPAEQTYRGAGYDFTLPRSLAAGLHTLAQEEAATLFMVAYAALVTLLGRYTGEEDIVVGSPIANRTRPELEGLI
ncbi:MAG TPA: condensation domain-containing protein, partial [Longimicrobiaceae bacterium]|nr:condensation domain-containing protein [Longimicrobiaceae bacterium]